MSLKYIFIRITLILFTSLSSTQSLICPDSSSKCRDGMTCCQLSSGKYGCCPLESAQCCSDGLHCCPNGTQCDNKQGFCLRKNTQNELVPLKLSPSELCPDKNHTCPEYQTCCKERSGDYGCCPYNLAVCCKDLLHCCPHGTRCDLIHKECVRQSKPIEDNHIFYFNKKMRLIGFKAKNITEIECSSSGYTCADGNTCCQKNDNQWGCCPFEKGVCCEDRTHCCPNYYKCTQNECQSK